MQYPRYSFTVVTFYQLISGRVKSLGTALLLNLVLLITTVNLIIFSSLRPRVHDHSTSVKKIRGTGITFQQAENLVKPKIPKLAIFPLLEHSGLFPLSDLSTMEISWILTSRKAHKIGSQPNRLSPSNTCSKLFYVPIAYSDFKGTIF